MFARRLTSQLRTPDGSRCPGSTASPSPPPTAGASCTGSATARKCLRCFANRCGARHSSPAGSTRCARSTARRCRCCRVSRSGRPCFWNRRQHMAETSLPCPSGVGPALRATSPRGEEAALVAVQSALADRPGVLAGARALSHFGEHSVGWIGVAVLGALLQPRRRRAWLATGVGAFIAHATAVLIKRVVRRERPHHPAVTVNVGTPSRLSFPSAHATSTTAAAVLLARVTGLPLPALLVPPMALSRMVLGVHYP